MPEVRARKIMPIARYRKAQSGNEIDGVRRAQAAFAKEPASS